MHVNLGMGLVDHSVGAAVGDWAPPSRPATETSLTA